MNIESIGPGKKLANFCISFYERILKETVSDSALVRLLNLFIQLERAHSAGGESFFVFVNENRLFLVDQEKEEVNIYDNELIRLPDLGKQYILLCRPINCPPDKVRDTFKSFMQSIESTKIAYTRVEEPIFCRGGVEIVGAVTVRIGLETD